MQGDGDVFSVVFAIPSRARRTALGGGQTDGTCSRQGHTVIDGHTRRFIAHAPFVFMASADADGMLDISPKGDRRAS